MAEQQSRRSNAVTSVNIDAPFENHGVRFGTGSLNLKHALDVLEGWSRHTNLWHEQEGEATPRPGQTALATHTGGAVHSIRKLRTPAHAVGSTTRLWGVGTSLQGGLSGLTTSLATGFSGEPLSLVPHRPALSSDSWMYVGDSDKMVKVRADGLVLPIGLPAPAAPVVTPGTEYRTNIVLGEVSDGTDAANWVGSPGSDQDGNASGTPTVEDDATASMVGSCLRFLTNDGSVSGSGGVTSTYDNWWGLNHLLDLTTLTPVGGGTARPSTDDDLIHFWALMSLPHLIEEIRLYFVISETFDPFVLPGTDTTLPGANQDAYVKAFRRGDFSKFISGDLDQISAAEEARIRRLRDDDLKDRGIADRRASWEARRAALDPERQRSVEMAGGAYQWVEFGTVGVPVRKIDFQRLGSSTDRSWATVTGVILYVRTKIDAIDRVVVVGLDDMYLHGGSGPDTTEPGAQLYDHRVTNYDPRTGAESNGSPELLLPARYDSMRRDLVVDPPAYGDAAVRQRIYRRGGSLIDDWYYVGINTADGAPFTDGLDDAALAASSLLHVDHFQPVPTIDRVTGATVLAQPVPALWGPLEGMLFACGDPHRPGHLYFSNANQPEHWSAFGNVEVCAPSEELLNGGILAHQGFVFSRAKLYLLYPNLSGDIDVTVSPSACTRGLLGRWAFCAGPAGGIFFVAEDGIFGTNGGPEEILSDAISPLFYGTAVNGYEPIDKTATHLLRLTCWENALYFQYRDVAGNMQVLVYSLLQKHWRHYHFAHEPAALQGEDEEILLLGGLSSGTSYTHEGTSDDGTSIRCAIRTGSASGGRREEKLFGDLFLDLDPDGADVSLQVFLNEESHANVEEVLSTATGRQRFLVHAFGASPQKAHSIACEVRWDSASATPILYQLGYALTLQPDLTNTRVTTWDDLNSPDEVWLSGVTLDCDTGGNPKTFHVERDFGGDRLIVGTFTVTSANRHKFKFSWPAVSAHMVRIRPVPDECAPWLLYRADWIYVQEPPRIAKWDIHFEADGWDQYYTGLDLYCDTGGLEKRIEVYVDGVRLLNTLQGNLPFWPITTTGRQVVHLTLPWGRGHVFRFIAIDDNPGLLYTHRWHTQPEPSEQANWNQNFDILGTRADKYLKAVIFECDTFDQDKLVQVEVDGTTVETLTVRANGRRVVQLSLTQQALGRVWRMFPIDAFPGRLYSAQPVFDEEPLQLARWETQETNHGLPGWFYPLYAHITLKSTADVTLTTVLQHNQVGGTTTHTYGIPATGGQKQRRFLHGFNAGKGVLIKYVLTSPEPFWLYRDETTVVIQPWGAANSITVQPFGNDDQDPARPMTQAVLAAQASGGAIPGNAGQTVG